MKRYACIIIDDPLLKENYGFLNYRKLLDLMDRHHFHTSIAFIPWNYNRTDEKIAALFRERPDRFSLCVHGCNHTRREFGITDMNRLDVLVKLATVRMIEHERMTGFPFDRVMVFPQGRYSNEAMEVLRENHYWAAVNTNVGPIIGPLSSSFPLFIRYRPEKLDFSYNPLLIRLHHNYFEKGYGRLIDLVDRLNAVETQWESLGNVIRHFISLPETTGSIDVKPSNKVSGNKTEFQILIRRYASEFRDNYIARNPLLLALTKRLNNLD